jgi:ABC-type nickel/cobalt efflux system permease component RcnA
MLSGWASCVRSDPRLGRAVPCPAARHRVRSRACAEPGYGNPVLASYLVSSRHAVVRRLRVVGALALTHVGSAVILALPAASLITRTLGGAGQALMLDALGGGTPGLIGLWFLVRAFRGRSISIAKA